MLTGAATLLGAVPSRSALIWVTSSARPRDLRARNPAPPLPRGSGLTLPISTSATSAAYPGSTATCSPSLLLSPALSKGNVDPPSVTTGESALLRPVAPSSLSRWREGDAWWPPSAVLRDSREV